jgi:cellulose synthase/poly-beta-1,6-N-acetylglucosamine synthase-like glycosyltransferase
MLQSLFFLGIAVFLGYYSIELWPIISGLYGVTLVSNLLVFFAMFGLTIFLGFGLSNAIFAFSWKRECPNPKKFPMVSICIPAYHEPLEVAKRCLDSCSKIDYPNFEVIFIEDDPIDPRIRKYCEKKGFRYLTRDNRKGFRAGALNYAVSAAKGKLVCFIDSDEEFSPSILRKGAGLLEYNQEAGFVQFERSYANMKQTPSIILSALEFLNGLSQSTFDKSGNVTPMGSGLFIKKGVFEKIGGFPEFVVEDFGINVRLKSNGYGGVYCPDIKMIGLAPETMSAVYSTIKRWSSGVTEVALAYWKKILGAPWRFKGVIMGSACTYPSFILPMVGFFTYAFGTALGTPFPVINQLTVWLFYSLVTAYIFEVCAGSWFAGSFRIKHAFIAILSIIPISLRIGFYTAFHRNGTYAPTSKVKTKQKKRFNYLPDLCMLVLSLALALRYYNFFFAWSALSFGFIFASALRSG